MAKKVDFKVNKNNKISYFDRISKGWFVMDSLQNEIDSVYCLNGYIADNHDFLALENGKLRAFAYDAKPYAMDTVVPGGDPNAIVEGPIIQEMDSNHNLILSGKVGITFMSPIINILPHGLDLIYLLYMLTQ